MTPPVLPHQRSAGGIADFTPSQSERLASATPSQGSRGSHRRRRASKHSLDSTSAPRKKATLRLTWVADDS